MPTALGTALENTSTLLTYDPSRGDAFVQVYEGTESRVRALFDLLRNTQPQLTISIDDSDKPKYRLLIRSPEPQTGNASVEPPVVWELLGNALQRDIWEHPNFKDITEHDANTLRKFMNNPQPSSSPAFTGTSTALDQANALYFLLRKGVTSYQVSQYVLRRSMTTNLAYPIKLTFNQVEYIWSTSLLQSREGIPAGILFSIAQIPTPTVPTNYSWGWLKQTPTVQQVSGNRYQITQEWWLELWSTYIYSTAS